MFFFMIFSLTGRKYALQGIERYKKLIFQKSRLDYFIYVADEMVSKLETLIYIIV